jgi:type IV pilus assembly protein PilA
MAILAAAIAPALIRYINKARRADDLTAAGEIVSAANTAMTNEAANDEVMALVGTNTGGVQIATINNTAVSANTSGGSFEAEMKKTLPNGAPKKFKKDGSSSYVLMYSQDRFYVTTDNGTMLNPSAAAPYDE